MNSLKILKG